MKPFTNFAETSAASGGLLAALGIDFQMLVFQIVAFLILVWLLGKYVYPIFIKTLDARRAEIEAGSRAAKQAEEKAAQAQKEVENLLSEARREAAGIVTTAKDEAAAALEAAEAKARARAERIAADAHDQIEKDIDAARKALRNETLQLVALATEKVVGRAVSAKVDEELITKAIREVK